MEKFIKDFHVEPEKIKDKSSKDSIEDKEEVEEESVTLQEQETLIIEGTQETNTITESKEHEVETQIIEETQYDSNIKVIAID